MANPQRGDVTIEVLGKAYTLKIDINAICELEDLLSTPRQLTTLQDVIDRMTAGSVRHVRAFVWAALRRHHKEMTLDDVGQFIGDAGGIDAIAEKLRTITGSTLPDPADLKDAGIDPSQRPRKARAARTAGTGARSRSKPGVSV